MLNAKNKQNTFWDDDSHGMLSTQYPLYKSPLFCSPLHNSLLHSSIVTGQVRWLSESIVSTSSMNDRLQPLSMAVL